MAQFSNIFLGVQNHKPAAKFCSSMTSIFLNKIELKNIELRSRKTGYTELMSVRNYLTDLSFLVRLDHTI